MKPLLSIMSLVVLAMIPLSVGAAPRESGVAPAEGVSVASLQLQKKLNDRESSLVMGAWAGTTITLLLSQPEKSVIGIDENASKLTSFTDDRGTDLAKAEGNSASWISAVFSKISEDGKLVAAPIRSNATPAAGAREITLKATIVLRCGGAQKTSEQKDVPLAAAGTKISAGPTTLAIAKSNKSAGNELVGAQKSVTLTSKTPLDAIKSIAFLDQAGKEIRSHVSAHSTMTFGAMSTYDATYSLEQNVDTATVRVTYYEKIENVSVPVDLKVGVGF
jgi:hypothetical protein